MVKVYSVFYNILTANTGYWVDGNGNTVGWGEGQKVFFEVNSSVITLGKMPGEVKAGETYTVRPVFVYTNNGDSKTLRFNITFTFK